MDNGDYFYIKCLVAGDEKAFVALYHKYHRKIYYSALKLTQSDALAQDVTQNVFIKIWDIRTSLNPELNFYAYLSTICRNAIFDLYKKAVHEEAIRKELQQFSELYEDSLDEDDFLESYRNLLNAAIDSLPAQRRMVFERCKLQEQTYEEVAKSLGIARSTVQDHIVKANKTIKDYIQKHGEFSYAILFSLLEHIV